MTRMLQSGVLFEDFLMNINDVLVAGLMGAAFSGCSMCPFTMKPNNVFGVCLRRRCHIPLIG